MLARTLGANGRLATLVVTLVVALGVRATPAKADTQVSDLFKKTVERMIKEIGVDQMKKACEKGEYADLCGEFVGLLGDFAGDALAGQLDKQTVVRRFREFATRALVSIAVDELNRWIDEHMFPELTGKLVKLQQPVRSLLRCVSADLLSRKTKDCIRTVDVATLLPADVRQEAASTGTALKKLQGGIEDCAAKREQAVVAICSARAFLDFAAVLAPDRIGRVRASFETVARVLERVSAVAKAGELFPVAMDFVAALDELDEYLLGSPNAHLVFDPASVSVPACPNLSPDLDRFKKVIRESYRAHALAIMSGNALDKVPPALALPVDARCPLTDPWWKAVAGFRFQATLSAAVHRFETPVLVAAALVDFVRSTNDDRLVENANRVVHFILARRIGSRPSFDYRCSPAGGTTTDDFTCVPSDPSRPTLTVSVTKNKNLEVVVENYLGTRYGVLAGHRNCFVQLLEALSGAEVVTDKGSAEAVCWIDDSISATKIGWRTKLDTLTRLLGIASSFGPHPDITINVPGGGTSPVAIMRWDPSLLIPAHRTPPTLTTALHAYARLRVPVQLDPEVVLDTIEQLLRTESSDPELDVAIRLIRALIAKDRALVEQIAIETAGAVIRAPVERFVSRMLKAGECKDGDDSTRCAVRAVALAFFEPLTQVIAGTTTDQDFVLGVARKLDGAKVLEHTPFLFEIGLAYTSLRIDPGMGNRWSQHFTVLDKWGFARKSRHVQAGVFVGGFIDSIIKTASDDESKQDARWLAGATLGFKHLGTLPISLSVYGAWAPPIDWDNSKKAWAFGGSINVPIDYVFGGSK